MDEQFSPEELIPQPLIFPDRRWKISFQRGDVKRSIRIPVIVPVLLLLCLLFMFISTLILLFGGASSGVDAKQIAAIKAENIRLKSKLEFYSATVDSIYKKIEALEASSAKPEGKGGTDHPYVPPRTAQESRSPQKLSLESRINDIDTKLGYILGKLGSDLPSQLTEDRPIVPPPTSGDGIPSIYPTFGELTSGFGLRIHPILNDLEFHEGIDIANEMGTPIYATADGVVRLINYENGYGKRMFISHQDGYETQYAHLYSYHVKEGDSVRKGQIIALMGNSGMSTGPHLHYEVIKDGDKINPTAYLNRIDTDQYAGR
jgi:murein DD-endopeptidase MepM/ murein hydrolase activator NlpD